MAIWIDPEKCNGCHGSIQPPCLRMCPGDLIVKDVAANKAYLKYVNDCWDCLPCVKVCPEEAIEFHLSPQFAPKGAKLIPHVKKGHDLIAWESIDRTGKTEVFEIRTKIIAMALDEKLEGEPQPLDFSI
ncbi:MAG: 4Fe-4S ferredoxin [Nitrospirota bacterium]